MTAATMTTTVAGLQGRALTNTAPTTNQAIAWNGSAWAPAGPFLPMTGGSITGTLAVSGSLVAASMQTGGGTAGTFLNGQGVNLFTGRGYGGKSFLNPQFNFTGTATLAGGSGLTITPHTTGLVLATASCQISNSAANAQVNGGLFRGTGAAPAQGTNIGGSTSIGYGHGQSGNGYTAGIWTPWSLILPWGGVTIGTQYWFDIGFSVPNNTGTGSAAWGNMWATEM